MLILIFINLTTIYYNFVITVEQFIQNEKQHTYVKTFMVDLENESFLSIADIFVDTNKVIELLTERIKKDRNIKQQL